MARSATLLLLVLRMVSQVLARDCNSTGESPITEASGLSPFTGCTVILGDLTIGHRDCRTLCTVEDLSALAGIQEIRGSLAILCCSQLETLDGLGSLTSTTGSVSIHYNQRLETISGFGGLRSIGGSLEVSQNRNLTTISGFDSLESIDGHFLLDRNTALSNMDGFSRLQTIQGRELLAGHALNILFNTALTDLRGLQQLGSIGYGTVHIEGNMRLCYAGYPQWSGEESYALRLPVGYGDLGIDWRTKLSMNPNNTWQYTWGVDGGGYPTLVIQNNADDSICVDVFCNFHCDEGQGCLGPASDVGLCGTCYESGEIDSCRIGPMPTSQTCDPTTIPYWPPDEFPYSLVFGVFFTFISILVIALAVVLVLVGIKLYMKFRRSRKGSFDIQLQEESTDSGVDLLPREDLGRMPPPVRHGSSSRTASYLARGVEEVALSLDDVIVASYQEKTERTSTLPRPTSTTLPSPSTQEGPEVASALKTRDTTTRPTRPTSTSRTASVTKSVAVVTATPSQKTETETKRTAAPTAAMETAEIPMNFPRDQLRLTKEYGTGDFGKVYQAEAKKLIPGVKKTTVVVKQLKDNATAAEKTAFLRPVDAMKILKHPNVLSLMGVCSEGPNIMVILEHSAQGNFKTYLVRKRPEAASLKQSGLLLRMASGMAQGLKYLHSRNIAHNDFAARSCLVMGNGTVKVGDYGLSRQTFKEDYYSRSLDQKAWPVRWMAPETIVLRGRDILDATPASLPGNIWSFGVALWEICSFARWPYEDLTNEEMIVALKSTDKCILENPVQPDDRLSALYNVMQLCWTSPDQRPSMTEVCNELDKLKGERKRPENPTTEQDKPVTRQDKPVGKSPPTAQVPQGRTASTGQYKPRRPAPRKPPGRPAPPRPPTKPKRDIDTSNEALLGSASLSLESEGSQSEGGRSTTSLKFYSSMGGQNLQKERSRSTDLIVSNGSATGKMFDERRKSDLQQRRATEGQRAVREADTALVLANAGANPREEWSDDEGTNRNSFILDPPVDFSQKDGEQEDEDEDEEALQFMLPEHTSALTYDFGPEYGEGIEDSPLVDRRNEAPPPKATDKQETEKATWKKRLSQTNNPMWLADDDQFDTLDRRDALEEDDVPNPVYDDDISQLLW